MIGFLFDIKSFLFYDKMVIHCLKFYFLVLNAHAFQKPHFAFWISELLESGNYNCYKDLEMTLLRSEVRALSGYH